MVGLGGARDASGLDGIERRYIAEGKEGAILPPAARDFVCKHFPETCRKQFPKLAENPLLRRQHYAGCKLASIGQGRRFKARATYCTIPRKMTF